MIKPFNILFVSSWFPSRIHRFNGDFVQRHAKAVSKMHNVTVLHAIGDSNIHKREIDIQTYPDHYKEIIVYFPKSKFKILNFFRKYTAYAVGAKEVETYDFIHAHVIHYDLFWVLMRRIFNQKKYIITEHSTAYYGNLSPIKKKFAQWLGKHASKIVPVSQKLVEAMKKQGIQGDYTVVPNVVNTEIFSPKKEKKHPGKFKFLHVSGLKEHHKNISGQLQAVKQLAEKGYDFEFHIGGNGDLAPIKQFIKENHTNYIHYFGALDHHQVAAKMREADAFILFSNKENQPCVITESFATGTPVIATDVGGINEFFPSNFGLIIAPKDIDSLVLAMEEVLQKSNFADPAQMHQYVHNQFSTEAIAKSFDEIYHSIINTQ
ncbi:glycosyltransferase [Flavobacteriaceae bacterium Ap0902]|nr:glycosyltransferase [Flavobacteriaceae bacterium Ap0902]